jgi:hypothetical protein
MHRLKAAYLGGSSHDFGCYVSGKTTEHVLTDAVPLRTREESASQPASISGWRSAPDSTGMAPKIGESKELHAEIFHVHLEADGLACGAAEPGIDQVGTSNLESFLKPLHAVS